MPVSWRISEGIVFVESDEQAAFDDWQAAVASALGSSAYRPGMGLLHDARRMERVPTLEEARMRVWFVVVQARTHNVPRWAVVVGGSGGHAMARMAETLTDDRSVAFRVFTDLAEAEAWIREPA